MPFKDSKSSYGAISKAFHWTLALLILGMIGVGWYMVDVPPPDKFFYYKIHKSTGICIVFLGILRLGWRFFVKKPDLPKEQFPLEHFLANSVQYLLYAFVILTPLEGWLMSSSGGHPVTFFGLFTVPAISPKIPELAKITHELHAIIAYTLLGIIALHVLGALRHHFVLKNTVLKRMLPGKTV
ncbi:MAG: cytochrome b [Alphaproteobacteria bacterium]|jgi:cytochrome b561|nr:cytochrome b [Alphaproteobacteria bacterium]MBT5390046.1 cytochrome b [Alphaproteobacteria bacterium]MBT5540306.1 cytochrome b [Alphaproteobacteria bacterium]